MKSYLEKSSGGGVIDINLIKGEMETYNEHLKAELQSQYDFQIDSLNAEVDAAETNALSSISSQLNMATSDMINTRETAKN